MPTVRAIYARKFLQQSHRRSFGSGRSTSAPRVGSSHGDPQRIVMSLLVPILTPRGKVLRRRRLLTLALAGTVVLGPGLEGSSQTTPPRDLGHGKELYVRYCSGCHGEDGRGEAKTFRPNVATLAVKELMDQLSDEYLFAAIQKGGAAVGKNAAMPAWSTRLGDDEIWDIVAFVRTLSHR